MIGNVFRGNGARGLLDYLASKDGAVLLSTNLDGTTPRSFARQFGDVRKLHPKETLADPVCHIPFRPAPGEDLTDDQWQEALEVALEAMGFSDSPYVAYLHDHGDGRHLHIATYWVTFEGRLVSDSFERLRVMAVARELEARFGLTVARRQRDSTLTRAEFERRLRDPKRGGQLEGLRRAVDQAASSRETLRQFLTELHRLGVESHLKVSRNGTLQGISFRLPDGSVIKGSTLGKRYSLASICNRHDLRIDRKATGPVLTVSEVTKGELELLGNEDLAPDFIARFGSRHTLYWTLPPGDEEAFTDLIALRLPHRFLGFSEAPESPWPQPPDLDGRARKAQLLREVSTIGSSAVLNVSLPDEPTGNLQAPDAPPTYATLAQRLELLSRTLQGAPEMEPADGAVLRATYREVMEEILPPSGVQAAALAELSDPRAGLAVTGVEDPDAFWQAARRVNATEAHSLDTGTLIEDQFLGYAPEPEAAISPAKSDGVQAEALELSAARNALSVTGFEDLAAFRRAAQRVNAAEARALETGALTENQLLAYAPMPKAAISPAKSGGVQAEALAGLSAARNTLAVTGGEDLAAFQRTAQRVKAAEARALETGALTEDQLLGYAPMPVLAARAAYERDPSLPSFHAWARSLQQTRPSPSMASRVEPPDTAVRHTLRSLSVELLAAHDRYTSDPSAHNHAQWRSLQAAYERLAHRLDSLPVRKLAQDRTPAATLSELRVQLLDAQDRHLANPSPASEAEWRCIRHAYQAAVATQPPATTPAPRPGTTVQDAQRELRVANRQLASAEGVYLSTPGDPAAQTAWVHALERVDQGRTGLVSSHRSQLAVLAQDLRQRVSDLAYYEGAYFRSPSTASEGMWRRAERAHLRAATAYEEARLSLRAISQEPRAPYRPVDQASRSATRLYERQFLESDPDRLGRLTRNAARSLWAQTDLGRSLIAASHPLRSVVRQMPGGGMVLSAASAASETARRSLAIYAELRAANDRARSRRAPKDRRSLEQGDFSTPALARAVVNARVPAPPIQRFSTLTEAVKASRSADATLMRNYRGFRRGLSSRDDLAVSAGRALAARAAVTERLHVALGLPTFRDVRAVLGQNATAAWVGALERAGLSARAIAVSVAETAPLLAVSGAKALAVVAARRVVRWTLQQFRNVAREILKEQNEGRR